MHKESTKSGKIAILGVFVADTAFRTNRLPQAGETLICREHTLGPGGKGSNQAVAAARAGADVTFISVLGNDAFAKMALDIYQRTGVTTRIAHHERHPTGAAFIHVHEQTGENTIIVAPGVASQIDIDFVSNAKDIIESAAVFVTQLEQPVDAAVHALQIARDAGVVTMLNTAPAVPVPDDTFCLCDYVTPNETEAAFFTGIAIDSLDAARHAGDRLLSKGTKAAVITLGERGVLVHTQSYSTHIPAFRVDNVVDTTGAGDAFNAGFATCLSRGEDELYAARYGCAVAALCVTREGTSDAMPSESEITALLACQP